MFRQDLRGQIRHRTQLQWQRLGRDFHGSRVIRMESADYYVGTASGDGCNCLVYSLLQCTGIGVVNVDAVRRDLMVEFHLPCGPACGRNCTRSCTKVYADNYLTTDHWDAVLRLLGRHRLQGPTEVDTSLYCVRVLELTWESNGVVLGDPHAPRQLTIARVHGNHFVPVLPYRAPVTIRHPW